MKNLVEITIPQPDQVLFDSAQQSLQEANAREITSNEELDEVGEQLRVVKGLQKSLEEKRTSITAPLNAALKNANDLFRPAKTWLEQAENVLKHKMLVWRTTLQEKARAEQARLDEEARLERERLANEAAEKESKAKEKADALRLEAETATDEDAVRLLKKAEKTEAAAAGKADALRDKAAAVVAPKVVAEIKSTKGQSVREVWDFEVVDASLVPNDYKAVDLAKIGAVVRATKGQITIPGIRVIKGESISSRAT